MLPALDTFADEMAIRIGGLSKRSLVALFWACSSALLPEYGKWATCVNAQTGSILSEALAAAHRFAASGQEPADKADLTCASEFSSAKTTMRGLQLNTPSSPCSSVPPSTSTVSPRLAVVLMSASKWKLSWRSLKFPGLLSSSNGLRIFGPSLCTI